jgi:hypothetical protein
MRSFLLGLEVVLTNSRRLEYLGMAFDLLEVAILPQLEIYLVPVALLFIERLVEAALRLVVALIPRKVLGAGKSLKFFMASSIKEPFFVAGRA